MLPKLGRYETLSKIAAGGMATVYLGRVVGEGGFERLVALKVMHPHIASDPDFVGMFLDEARLAARIRHPNVVATIDIQKTEDAMFIVMDYVDGPTLQEVRKHLKSREERVPIGIALRFFIDILNGLQEAHELCDKDGSALNLVHRDVSPHNILIGQDGRAQLTDFGVAKAEARISSTRGGQLKGKIAYMPPEQIIAQPVDRRADVYSAGVCMWECLVGKRLFRAANDGALVHMILEGSPTPPSKYCDDIPAAVEGVLMKAISRKPEDRYDEAVDFAEALEDAARESKLKIPKQRAVGQFIKEIVSEIGKAPVSTRSLTPPSAPSQQKAVAAVGSDSGASAPSSPSMRTGPSVSTGPSKPRALPTMPVRSAPHAPPGPPPIPDIDDAGKGKLPRPGRSKPALPRAKKKPVPPRKSARSAPSAPAAEPSAPTPKPRPPTKSKPAAIERPPIKFDEIEDPPTEVMNGDRSMSDLVNNSQPSAVTSPTQTAAIYSLAPPPSRHGIIAVAVAGAFLLLVLVAVFVGSPDDSETTLELEPVRQPEPDPPTPKPAPTPSTPARPSSSAAGSASTPTVPSPRLAPTPNPFPRVRPPGPRPDPTKPSPNPFKPKGL